MKKTYLWLSVASSLFAALSTTHAATTLAGWTFDGLTQAAPYNTSSATTGSGTAVVVGMANTYNGGATTANADVLATNGASTGVGSKAWRTVGTPTIGWSTNAPIGSQGAQFSASSAGYYQISVSFDVFATNGGERALQVQYNIDGTTNWYNATSLTSGGTATVQNNANPNNSLVVGSYVTLATGWNNKIQANLAGIPGLDNNTNLLIRLVNAATGTNCLTTGNTNYNNSTGYWGFDNVVISGVSYSLAAKWNFDGQTVAAPDNYPSPSSGTGTTLVLGMTNTYTFASGPSQSYAFCDVTPTAGASTGAGASAWRVRGGATGAGAPNSGWNDEAPIGTQGIECDVPTGTYSNILIGFDMYLTSQGPAKWVVEYTTNASTWTVAPNLAYTISSSFVTNNDGSDGNTVTGLYLNFTGGGQNFYDNVVVDLTGVATANLNANFGIRVVNAATSTDDTAASFVGGVPVTYNNLSGNARFDNIIVGGQYAGQSAPVLTNQANASVDAPFTNTFADSSAWRSAITAVYVNGVLLTNTAYTVSSGMIVYNPTNSVLLQTGGIKVIAIDATSYSEDKISQPLATGVAVQLAITTQAAGPTASGGTLVSNPVLGVTDKWGNGTAVAPNTNVYCFATVGGGATTWILGGSTNQADVNGFMVFTDMTATVTGLTAVTNCYITFTVSNYNGEGSALYITNSVTFGIGAPTVPFTPGNLAVLQIDTAAGNNSTFSVIEVNSAEVGQTTPVSVTPISATGATAMRLANTGTIGRLSLSDDGTLICFAAFRDNSAATSDETFTLTRAAGSLNYTNLFAEAAPYVSTSLGGSQARSATTVDDVNFLIDDKAFLWLGGPGAINGPFNNNNNVVVKSFGGQVYVETQKSSGVDPYNAIFGVDISNPMSPSYDPSLGYPLGVDANAQDFYMISTDGGVTFPILYIMDTIGSQAVLNKYSLLPDGGSPNGSSWTAEGTFTNDTGGDSLFACTNGSGGVYLYLTTAPSSSKNNKIVRVTDESSYDAPMNITSSNVIYKASGGVYLKGITFVPAQTAYATELTPPPLMIPAVGVLTNSPAFNLALSPDDSTWRASITNVTVNGTSVLSSVYSTSTGMITFYPPQSPLLSNAGLITIEVQALGYSPSTVVQPIGVVYPALMTGVALNGSQQVTFTFTNTPGLSFSVLSTNTLMAPLATWPLVGTTTENPAGIYNFTNSDPSTNGQQYFIIRQP